MAMLYLIGIERADPDGAARLEKLLEDINPTAIAVDMDEQRAQFVLKKFESLKKIGSQPSTKERFLTAAQQEGFNRETVEEFYFHGVGLNYGFLIPKLHWEPKGVPVTLVGSARTVDDAVKKLTSKFPLGEQVGHEIAVEAYCNPLKLSPPQLRETVNTHYQLRYLVEYRRLVMEGLQQESGGKPLRPKILNVVDNVLTGLPSQLVLSDFAVEKNLRGLCKQDGRIVLVSNFAHLFVQYGNGEKNLYERMSDLHPERRKPYDADKYVSKQ